MLKRRNKKGSLLDILFVGITLLVISVIILICFTIYGNIKSEIDDADVMTTSGTHAMEQVENIFPTVLDNTYLILMIGMAIVAFIFAALVRVHPIFMVFFFIMLVFVIFFAGVFSNIYQGIAIEGQMSTYADKMVFMTFVMEFLPFIVGILGSALALFMYKLGAEG